MQVKLLRAIQMGEIRPVGENVSRQVNVRLIAATNKDLALLVGEGRFREDLFYRINVFPVIIPPLRERPEDIRILIQHFLDKLSVQTRKAIRGIDPAAMDLLVRHSWPGNVRELENEIERAHVLTSDGRNISVRSLSSRVTSAIEKTFSDQIAPEKLTLKDAVDDMEKRMVQEALGDCNGNRTMAAKRLGLSRQGLLNKMHKFGLSPR
jgi:transcriptional regulator with PAS, ATPase and Fis domain